MQATYILDPFIGAYARVRTCALRVNHTPGTSWTWKYTHTHTTNHVFLAHKSQRQTEKPQQQFSEVAERKHITWRHLQPFTSTATHLLLHRCSRRHLPSWINMRNKSDDNTDDYWDCQVNSLLHEWVPRTSVNK